MEYRNRLFLLLFLRPPLAICIFQFKAASIVRSGTVVCFLQWPDGNPSVSLADTV